jgi:hypothetical protein
MNVKTDIFFHQWLKIEVVTELYLVLHQANVFKRAFFSQFDVNVFLYTAPKEQSHYLVEE